MVNICTSANSKNILIKNIMELKTKVNIEYLQKVNTKKKKKIKLFNKK